MISFESLSKIINGNILSFNQSVRLQHYIFDSRQLISTKESVFIAIKGKNHNGHDYLEDLFGKGIKNFIVEEKVNSKKILESSNVFMVPDSIKALQDLAKYHRNQFRVPVIGITGSNGKTIVKEWLALGLNKKFSIAKSPKSYNSQLGVPLSLLQIHEAHDIAIIEAGISTSNEMVRLAEIIKPTLGIFTNIGTAHDEGFENEQEKLKEKWKLFESSDTVILSSDHEEVVKMAPKETKMFTWGFNNSSDVKIISIHPTQNGSTIEFYHKSKNSLDIPFRDKASTENLMHCVTMWIYLGYQIEEIEEIVSGLNNIPMRMQLKEGINNTILVDDTYNNDLAGVKSLIEYTKNLNQRSKKTLLLSDIVNSSNELHETESLIELINESDFNRLITIGNNWQDRVSSVRIPVNAFSSTNEFLDKIDSITLENEYVVLKGARTFHFEDIVKQLEYKSHETVLEINLDSITHNLNFYRQRLNQNVKLMVMVKAFAYGSGLKEIANLLEFHQVDYLAVAYPDEAIELRENGVSLPIMVMNCPLESFEKIIQYRAEPEIYSIRQLHKLVSVCNSKKQNAKIHLKVDTGMHRLGFEHEEITEALNIILSCNYLKVASIFTHLAGSDDDDHIEFTKKQLHQFEKDANIIIKALDYKPLLHALNSPGIIRYPQNQYDMVRLGIGLYGYEANNLMQENLKPISTLKTTISQIKIIAKGETIGYGRKGLAKRDLKIATIAIGYADGFSRSFSNGVIKVNVNGQLAPVIGNVCMDMSMIDITDIEAREGDQVIIFGANPTIMEQADAIKTIPYEILTSISGRVKRVYFSE